MHGRGLRALWRQALVKPDVFILIHGILLSWVPLAIAPHLDPDGRTIRILERAPVIGEARIIRIIRSRLHEPYRLEYEYSTPGGTREGSDWQHLDLEHVRSLPTRIPVIWSANQPEISMALERYQSRRTLPYWPAAQGLALLFGLMLIFRLTRIAKWLRHGSQVMVRIESMEHLLPGPPAGIVRVSYRVYGRPGRIREIFSPTSWARSLKPGDRVEALVVDKEAAIHVPRVGLLTAS